jgi:four helix bundle protein
MTLKIYAVVLELVRKLAPHLPVLRARSATLGDQLERALISIPLNLAEGAYTRGKNRYARYQSAAASAREALACLETAEALGWAPPLERHTLGCKGPRAAAAGGARAPLCRAHTGHILEGAGLFGAEPSLLWHGG